MPRRNTRNTTVDEGDEFKAFLLVVRQALLMIVRWIEKRYELS